MRCLLPRGKLRRANYLRRVSKHEDKYWAQYVDANSRVLDDFMMTFQHAATGIWLGVMRSRPGLGLEDTEYLDA